MPRGSHWSVPGGYSSSSNHLAILHVLNLIILGICKVKIRGYSFLQGFNLPTIYSHGSEEVGRFHLVECNPVWYSSGICLGHPFNSSQDDFFRWCTSLQYALILHLLSTIFTKLIPLLLGTVKTLVYQPRQIWLYSGAFTPSKYARFQTMLSRFSIRLKKPNR